MTIEPMPCMLVGSAIGLLAAVSGLGAGLSLPWLAWMGVPLPGALLATKLVCMVGDTGA